MHTKASLCIVVCAGFMSCCFTPAETRSSKVLMGNGTILAAPPTAEDAAGAAAAPDIEWKGTQPVSRADAGDWAAGEKETAGAALEEGRGAGTTVPPSLTSWPWV